MDRIYEPEAYVKTVNSYWETTATPPLWPEAAGEISAETVIIGGGFTGLNCALELAETGHDPASIVIVEAMQPGWGASGRNGGFCGIGGSKLPVAKQIARFGEAETRRYFEEQKAAIETVRDNLVRYAIDAETHSRGETELAHRQKDADGFAAEAARMKSLFDSEARILSKAETVAEGLASPTVFGALETGHGFALNPMRYVTGLARAALAAGISCFGGSPMTGYRSAGGRYRIETPGAAISARNLVIATNGYSSDDLPRWLGGRLLPVLSNIVLSRPLSEAELADQGWTSHQMVFDSRNLLHYLRLIPARPGEDGPRMLFGMRGGTSASAASHSAMHRMIRRDFETFFPAWRSVETPFFWSGLVCLTRDLTSYTGPVPGMANAWLSVAYHGNGVSMGSHCGRLAGRMISGRRAPDAIPVIMRQPPRRFPFPALRRNYLRAAYAWYGWTDRG